MSPTTLAGSVVTFVVTAVLFRFAPMTRDIYDRLGPDGTVRYMAVSAFLVCAGIAIFAADPILEAIQAAGCAGGLIGVLLAVRTFRRRQAVPGAGAEPQ